MLLPHEMYGAMFHHYRLSFDTWVRGRAGKIAEFWTNMSPDDPRLFNNPVTEQDGYMEFCIPLRIH